MLASKLLAARSDLLGFALVFKYGEVVTGGGSSVQSKDRYGNRWAGDVNLVTAFVHHGADLSAELADEHVVTDAKGSVLNEKGCDVATSFVEGGFNDGSFRQAVGVCLEVEDFGLKQHFFKELVDVEALLGRDIL